MRNRACGALLAGVLAAMTLCSATCAPRALAESAGTVHFVRFTEPSFDKYLEEPSPSMQAWLNAHIWRMGVYAPYFDTMTSWYPNGWLYKDSYALYTDEAVAAQHPEWVLKDAAGNPLYIPWGCANGSCPQYAANIANSAYRQWWIANAKAELSAGYRGLFVDDVNMEMRVGDDREEAVAPIDPATGQPMTAEAWRGYMASFMREVRVQLPGVEIVHNAIWYADGDAGTANANIRAELESANYVFLERGVNDAGLTGGEGPWSLHALLSFVDQVHALGRGVVLDGTSSEPQGLTYNLASYLLVSDGSDAVSGGGQTPESWWSGWSVSLGEASGPRYTWDHLLRRDFAGGMVLVNPPGEPTETVDLPAPMRNAEGATVISVTLAAASGAILQGTPPAAGAGAGTVPSGEGSTGAAGGSASGGSSTGSTGGSTSSGTTGSGTSSSGGAGSSSPSSPSGGAYIGPNAPNPALPPTGRRGSGTSRRGSGERSDRARVEGGAVLAHTARRHRRHRRARAARRAPGRRPAR
jgi:hypothetical protein